MDHLKYHIISLGCAKNQADSERLNASMLASGFERAEGEQEAEIIIINTCGFIQSAKEEAISVILDAVSLKDEGKAVVVLGCLAERYREDVSRDIPEIDIVYGLYDDKFAQHLINHLNLKKKAKSASGRAPLENLPYEYIKISEGCSNNCSYCAIPLIRGPHQSFPFDDIISDAKGAAGRGAKELIVVAQDIASYKYKSYDLCKLVAKISSIAGPEWIRLMYLHPDHLTDEIIEMIASTPKVLPYVDVPFQHASEKILRAMNRCGNAEKYLALVDKLRSKIPGIAIRSTFLLGFPGEEDDDFAVLMDFISKARLDRVGAFMYSPEDGTAAFGKKCPPKKIVKARFDSLMKLQQKISTDALSSRVGTRVGILVEEKIDDKTYACRSVYDAPEVDGFFYLTDVSGTVLLNTVYDAAVTDSTEYDLIGEI